MQNSRMYMREALRIAFLGMGTTSPNPSVGAVIVKEGEILASGRTCAYGCDHAEVDAIKNAGPLAGGADMYVSLEPCCHYGNTPPCTDNLIEAGIKRVYVPLLDPNPIVAGKGIERLRNAGIEVILMDEFSDAAADLIRPFKKYIQNKMPFVVNKMAETLDGKSATACGDSKWISSEHSRFVVHRFRTVVDAIIAGKNTLVNDNPALSARPASFSEEVRGYFAGREFKVSGYENFLLRMLLEERGHRDYASPLRVIAGIPEELNAKANIFYDENFIFFVEKKVMDSFHGRRDSALVKKLDAGGKIVPLSGGDRAEQVKQLLEELYRRGIMYAMLEGGSRLAGSFFDAGCIDQFLYIISPRVMGGGLSSIEGKGVRAVGDAWHLKKISTVMVGDDMLYSAYKEP